MSTSPQPTSRSRGVPVQVRWDRRPGHGRPVMTSRDAPLDVPPSLNVAFMHPSGLREPVWDKPDRAIADLGPFTKGATGDRSITPVNAVCPPAVVSTLLVLGTAESRRLRRRLRSWTRPTRTPSMSPPVGDAPAVTGRKPINQCTTADLPGDLLGPKMATKHCNFRRHPVVCYC